MLAQILFTTILAAVASVNADPTPTVPGPGDTYNEGSNCQIEWTADPTGAWKTMNIELMTGGNLAMKHLTSAYTRVIPAFKTNRVRSCYHRRRH
jgi:hypothetical protein